MKGLNFHTHPNQEEILYVLEGTVEQWIEKDNQLLNAGDAVFVPAGIVHASFNASDQMLKGIVIFGPSVGEMGFEQVDVSDEEPWKSLRQ